MSSFLVTGATGFIGKHLVDRLAARGDKVYALVREGSLAGLQALIAQRWGEHEDRVVPVEGDISLPACGVEPGLLDRLRGEVQGVFHLAAIYDMAVDAERAHVANVEGTRHALSLAHELDCRFHHVSSIAVTGGVIDGVFTEDMFDEGQQLEHPYYATKFESEALVRREARVPYRIYRPGVVIGSSKTGEADKADGPYYMFPLFKLAKRNLPPWLPMAMPKGGVLNVVPVDYVADAMVALSGMEGLDGRAFHLLQRNAPSMYEAMRLFAKAAGVPRLLQLPKGAGRVMTDDRLLRKLPLGPAVKTGFLQKMNIPESALDALEWKTRFDTSQTDALLEPLGIQCPPLAAYAPKIWEYYNRELAPGRRRRRGSANGAAVKHARERQIRSLRGKRVVVTGASSGIGEAVALRAAREGAVLLLVARGEEKLRAVAEQVEQLGGEAHLYPCDLSDGGDVDALVQRLDADGPVDILVNNAGRSIRRSISRSYDRFHDFERTMQLNYFGALRLTLGLMPGMRERKNGHIINISSAGVAINTPRFAAYIASKAAFDAFSRVAAGEVLGDNVHFTTVYMPLVRTKMIAPTRGYDSVPALTPEQAADMVVRAMFERPRHVRGTFAALTQAGFEVAPKLMDRAWNFGYRFSPGSNQARRPVSA